MLTHLSITNYAIIENVELTFNDGFTVITGETGAGKSILLGALSLILGKRADVSVLNNKEKKCIVEGEFQLDKTKYFSFFKENELDFEKASIIRREINSNGKSRAFINDTPVSLSVLKELTIQLIDIHSQHQTLQIKSAKFQLNVIDAFANLDKEKSSYVGKYVSYANAKKELTDLVQQASNAKTDLDYITFQANEIEELALKPNEKEKIEAELEIINNAEEIKSVLDYAATALTNSDKNILLLLKNITTSFSKIANCSETYTDLHQRLTSLEIELEDLSNEIDVENTNLSFNPENLSFLNDRISKIYAIEQKHNTSTSEELLLLLEKFKLQLSNVNSFEEKITVLTKNISKQEIALRKEAEDISKKRKQNFEGLSNKIKTTLNLLGMSDAVFDVKHETTTQLTENGIDKIEFLFSANKGVAPQELSKAASGGELSRLMLTIKSILANNKKLSTIIFDEIDTGVSGDIADKMATIMQQMSKNMQVISITHLPQVAAKGKTHYKIFKENKGSKTLTSLTILNKENRVAELAKMLSGEKLSDAAIENAKILLKN